MTCPETTAREQGVEAGLRLLVGQPVTAFGRGITLLWVGFGARRTVPARRGGTREVSTYALHTESTWRLAGPDGPLVGRDDIFVKRGETERDFDEPPAALGVGGTRFDEIVEVLRPALDGVVVTGATLDAWRGVRLDWSHGYRFEILPDGTAPDVERWRLFRVGRDEPHLVVHGVG